MKKTFPIEDVLTFTSGRFISFKSSDLFDTEECVLYQIANFITGKKHSPFDLSDNAPLIRLLIKEQFPEITDWDIGTPVGGWESTNESKTDPKVALENKKQFTSFLIQKFNRTSFDLTGPDPT